MASKVGVPPIKGNISKNLSRLKVIRYIVERHVKSQNIILFQAN